MVFTRTESVILISCSILFGCFFLYLLYRLCKITFTRINHKISGVDANADDDANNARPNRPKSAREQRVADLLARPGVRRVLTSRMSNSMLSQPATPRRPPPSCDRISETPPRIRFGISEDPLPGTRIENPPPYEDDTDISVYSGPPPSYHSKMGEEEP